MEVLEALGRCQDDKLRSRVERSIACISRTLDLYGTHGTAFSFNGGKDSTVLLHLIRAAVAQHADDAADSTANGVSASAPLGGILTFFFHHDNDFPEVLEFVHATNEQYGLGMRVLYGDFKAGLEALLAETAVRAILLGTRRGDPNAGDQETFCPSSAGWPPFMRVNPILDWSYHDVWSFLQLANLPYCSLYDRGFSSIGSVTNTEPNAALRREDGTYAPAHLLPDARLERAGRACKVARQRTSVTASTKTAGLVIIGDEILSAKVEDVNTPFLCGELRALGWRVNKARAAPVAWDVVLVRDSIESISREVKAASEACDIVLTAGGVGPTLDDVTMAAIADAFGVRLGRHAELEARSEVQLIEHVDGGRLSPFPLVCCRNVYILPGIPALVQKKWEAVCAHLGATAPAQPKFRTILLRLMLDDETKVAGALEKVAAEVGEEEVCLGSYPIDGAGVVLSLESKAEAKLEQAHALLVRLLPPGVLLAEQADSDQPISSPMAKAQLSPAAQAFAADPRAE
eukprot:scaffold3.g6739.t1